MPQDQRGPQHDADSTSCRCLDCAVARHPCNADRRPHATAPASVPPCGFGLCTEPAPTYYIYSPEDGFLHMCSTHAPDAAEMFAEVTSAWTG